MAPPVPPLDDAAAAADLPLTRGMRVSFAVPGRGDLQFSVPVPDGSSGGGGIGASVGGGGGVTAAAADEVEDTLVGTMQDMRIAHVDRNAELKEQLDAIDARQAATAAALAAEVATRDAQLAGIRAAMAAAFDVLEREMSGVVAAAFAVGAAALPPIHARLDADAAVESEFYNKTVPETNERQCGGHIREMRGHREALELDRTTIMAREAKMHGRIDALASAFETRCRVEAEDRSRQYDALMKQQADSVRSWCWLV